jgi:hypothetical protein
MNITTSQKNMLKEIYRRGHFQSGRSKGLPKDQGVSIEIMMDVYDCRVLNAVIRKGLAVDKYNAGKLVLTDSAIALIKKESKNERKDSGAN